jgi:hypothetical protein
MLAHNSTGSSRPSARTGARAGPFLWICAQHAKLFVPLGTDVFTSLRLQNFKGFGNLTLSSVAPVTLIGGTNNVGKTSILEALFLLVDRLNPQMFSRQLVWRSGAGLPSTVDNIWAPYFPSLLIDGTIIVEARDEAVGVIRLELSFDPDFRESLPPQLAPPAPKTDTSQSGYSALRVLAKIGEHVVQESHLVITATNIGMHVKLAQPVHTEAVFLGARAPLAPQDDARRLSVLDVQRRLPEIVELLRPMEPRLRGLSEAYVGETPQIFADIEGLSRKIPIGYVGQGMARLTSMLLAIMATARGLVIIDEVENGLHHSLLPEVWRVLGEAAQRANTQLILTSHSYECLQAAYGCFSKTEGVFQYTRIDRVGAETKAVSYSLAELGAALENRVEVR